MRLKRFLFKNVIEEGPRKMIHNGVLNFEVVSKGYCIRNTRPFQMKIEESGMIHNFSDRMVVGKREGGNFYFWERRIMMGASISRLVHFISC